MGSTLLSMLSQYGAALVISGLGLALVTSFVRLIVFRSDLRLFMKHGGSEQQVRDLIRRRIESEFVRRRRLSPFRPRLNRDDRTDDDEEGRKPRLT